MKKKAINFVMSVAVTFVVASACSKKLAPTIKDNTNQSNFKLSAKNINAGFPARSGAYDASPLFFEDFNGISLDTTKWFPRSGTKYYGSITAVHQASNLRVDSGMLYIDVKKSGPTTYTCGGVISKALFGYGYYEARVAIYKNTPGVHQSFWSMGNSPAYLASQDLLPKSNAIIELDGFEAESGDQVFKANIHSYIPRNVATGQQTEVVNPGWCNVGFEWLPTKLNWYVNGTLVQTKNLISPFNVYAPQNLWLTALYYSSTAYQIDSNASMRISYFKFYPNKTLKGVNILANPSFEYKKTNDVFPLQDPLGWIETSSAGHNPEASMVVDSVTSQGSLHFLKHTKTSNYLSTTKQNLAYIANGTYKLTALINSSPHVVPSRMRVLNYGGAELSANLSSGGWATITIDNIKVTNHKAVIAFTSTAKANEWIEIDNVVFAKIK